MTIARPLIRASEIAAIALLLLLLSACVTPTPYQPAPPRGFGFSEVRIDANKYRVSFRGNSLTKRETVEDYLLYRAAELTLQNGYSHFLVVGQDTEAKTSYRYWMDHYGGRGWFYHRFPGWYDPWYRDPFGPSWVDVRPVTTYTASADIIMLRANFEDKNVRAFDAQQVLVQVGPRVIRPEQAQ